MTLSSGIQKPVAVRSPVLAPTGGFSVFGVTSSIADNTWFGISPISAGIFGIPLGFAVIIIVSLLTPKPSQRVQELIEHVRYPHLRGDISTQAT